MATKEERDREAGQAHRERMAMRSRAQSSAAADIGELPPVADPERKAACSSDLFLFLTTYFPATTGLKPFSDDHRKVIGRIQSCIVEGGRFVNAVYRGFAKTTIAENSTIWALIYGYRKFVPIFSANQSAADEIMRSVKSELSDNSLLLEDFPEVCYPIYSLAGKWQKAPSQAYRGELTHILWNSDTIAMPVIPGSLASSGILRSFGLESASRGMKYKRADGTNQRPDMVLLDDVQTDESARHPLQVRGRLGIIQRNILRQAGHFKRLAAVINGTVIYPQDLMETLLDPKQNPSFQGERIKMVRRFADAHENFWMTEYRTVRNTFDRNDPADQKRAWADATKLYLARRNEADKGCEISWEHCYSADDGEVSAIQHAYNILVDDGQEVFDSECQGAPKGEAGDDKAARLTCDMLGAKLNGLARAVVPRNCAHVTAYVDVHKQILFWLVAAWEKEFGGVTLDYGTWPKQPTRYFAQSDPPVTLEAVYSGLTEEAWVLAGLNELTTELLGREFLREDQAVMRIERLLGDTQYKRDTVQTFARRHMQAGLIMPAVGGAIGAKKKPFAEYKREPGMGLHCISRAAAGERHVWIDTYWWKTFTNARLLLPAGTRGGWEFFGRDRAEHGLLFDHLTSERFSDVTANQRTVREWDALPNRDNHWWDCLVGSAVAASMLGCLPAGLERRGRQQRNASERMTLSDLAKG